MASIKFDIVTENSTVLSDLRAIEVSSNSYLADIAKYAKGSYSESVATNEQLGKIFNRL